MNMGTGEKQSSTKTSYQIEVEHEPGTFDDDMDFLTAAPKDAYERLQYLKEKYSGHKITITKVKETKTHEPISENDLEKIAKSP
jgi:hypothetical protein